MRKQKVTEGTKKLSYTHVSRGTVSEGVVRKWCHVLVEGEGEGKGGIGSTKKALGTMGEG